MDQVSRFSIELFQSAFNAFFFANNENELKMEMGGDIGSEMDMAVSEL